MEIVDVPISGSIPAQGNSDPPNRFTDHAVVMLSNAADVYDPSYGVKRSSYQAWRDEAEAGILYRVPPVGDIRLVPHQAKERDTKFWDPITKTVFG